MSEDGLSRRTFGLRHYVIAIVALLILPACGSDDNRFAARASCDTVSEGPADLASVDTTATPRADTAAETLALEVSGEFIAPEALYQRVLAELTGIRASLPEVQADVVKPCYLSGSVVVRFTEDGFQQVQDGAFAAWDDLNANLRLDEQTVLEGESGVALHFEGRYDVNRLAIAYSELPEVTAAEPNALVGDGPDICLAQREQTHFYIFRDARGDCPAGCLHEDFTAVSVDASGNFAVAGEWDASGDPPLWLIASQDCLAFL